MESLFTRLAARPQRSIILLSLLLLLAGNWILPLTDRDEARFAEASREMLQRGDYIVPWFNGAWRFDKPVLIYWCQMASYSLFGENAFAARLPSVLFTTATALLLVRWGRKIADAKTGFLAGVMFVAGLHIAVIGRMATADMAMIFFVTLALWSGWELTRPEHALRRKWWWIFYVALALGFLAKGPVAWLPLGGMIVGRITRKSSFRLPLNETVVGLSLTMALVALWGGPALAQTGGKFWSVGMGEHVLNRSVGVLDSHGAKGLLGFIALLPLYFLTFFVSFFPWSTRVPGTIRRWWPERKRDNLGWYLLMNAAIVFVIFSLVRTKLPHYTLPAFPCIALWLARQISLLPGLSAWAGRRLVAMTVFVLVLMIGVTSFMSSRLLTLNLWRATRPYIKADTKIGCFGYVEPSQVWHFRNVTTNYVTFGNAAKAKDFLTNTSPFVIILPTEKLADLPNTNGILFPLDGLDFVKFQNRKLTAIIY